MATHDDPRNKYQHNLADLRASDEVAEADKDAIETFLAAIDPDVYEPTFVNADGETETKSVGTLHSYTHNLKRVAVISDTPLVELESAEAFNRLMDAVASGEHPHPSAKADGYSAGTLKGWQSAASKFYQYHDDLGVDPAHIVIAKQDRTSVDERDVYTAEDIEALRAACDNTRDRALLELLIYTGQRIRVVQTLRVKDVDVDRGVYWLNDEVDGLKNADKNGGKRPLLGATGPVDDWLDHHPVPEPEAALLTCRPSHNRGIPGEPVAQSTIRHTLRKLADRAGVDKPPNPHNFRHYFVTVAHRKYGMKDSTIKYLIGHGPDSMVMQTTYQHLSDEDHIRDAEESFGIREPEDVSLTPEVCLTCKNPLPEGAKACQKCGAVYTPDAVDAQQGVDQDLGALRLLAQLGEIDLTVEQVDELAADPERRAGLIQKRAERSG